MTWTDSEIDLVLQTAGIKFGKIKKGTLLYRATPIPFQDKLEARYDKDTGQMGLYFSDGPIIPFGMVLEYKKPLNICVYEVNHDIEVVLGKYKYRDLDPTYYYKNYQDFVQNKFILNKDSRMNISSVDRGFLPLHPIFQCEVIYDKVKEHEIFLTDEYTNNFEYLTFKQETDNVTPKEALDAIKNYTNIV